MGAVSAAHERDDEHDEDDHERHGHRGEQQLLKGGVVLEDDGDAVADEYAGACESAGEAECRRGADISVRREDADVHEEQDLADEGYGQRRKEGGKIQGDVVRGIEDDGYGRECEHPGEQTIDVEFPGQLPECAYHA